MKPVVIRPAPAREYWSDEGCYILEASNSSADESLSIARARVPPGRTTRAHRLSGTTERYVILEGSGRVELDGSLVEFVGPGDVVLIPPSVDQRITNVGNDDLVFLALCTPRFTQECYADTESP